MRIGLPATFSLVCLAAPAAAQPVLTHDGDAYTVHATRITTPMRIDGRLDEGARRRAIRAPRPARGRPSR
jgi:hypothetical protein